MVSKNHDTKLSIAHIVNPVIVKETSDLFTAQPITFESMKNARDCAVDDVDVELFSAQYREDRSLVPGYLQLTRDMDRSILDIFPNNANKKLPFIRDVLDRLYEASDAQVLIYSNVDIGLAKIFYSSIAEFVKNGHDAICLSRRVVPAHYRSVEELPKIYDEEGTSLPGWDCFVFRRELYPKFELDGICLGAPGVDRAVLCNLISFGDKYICANHEKLIFHIGNDSDWLKKDVKANVINIMNRRNSLRAIATLCRSASSSERKILLKEHYVSLRRKISPWREFIYRAMMKIRKLSGVFPG